MQPLFRSHSYIAEASSSTSSCSASVVKCHLCTKASEVCTFELLPHSNDRMLCTRKAVAAGAFLKLRVRKKVRRNVLGLAAASVLHLSQEQARSNEIARLAKQGNQGCLSCMNAMNNFEHAMLISLGHVHTSPRDFQTAKFD